MQPGFSVTVIVSMEWYSHPPTASRLMMSANMLKAACVLPFPTLILLGPATALYCFIMISFLYGDLCVSFKFKLLDSGDMRENQNVLFYRVEILPTSFRIKSVYAGFVAAADSIRHFLLGQCFCCLEFSFNLTAVLHFFCVEVKKTGFVKTECNLDFCINSNTCR